MGEIWYPEQVKVFKKWKYFKYEAKKNDNKAPNIYDDHNEEDSDLEEEKQANYMEAIRKNKNNYSLFVEDIGIEIGWSSRLIECDKFTLNMNKRQYFKFAKCREASLTSQKKKFYQWLNIKPFDKILTYFLGFIAWDRIGCILQIARKLNGDKHGAITFDNHSFLTPTQITEAILRINALPQITPIQLQFVDHSFEKINTSQIAYSQQQNKRKYDETDNEEKDEIPKKKMKVK